MRTAAMRLCHSAILVLLAGVANGCAPAAEPYAEAIAASRALIDSLITARSIPGLSIAVSVDRQIVWSEGFGFADLELGVQVSPTTKFRIGSISKTLTASALAQLYEAGKLDLDAPIQRYVPSFPEKRKGALTTRLIAGHLGGIRHYNGIEFLSSRRYDTVVEGLEIFRDDTLLFTPGEQYSYSTYGWNLLSAVVESLSGEDFLSYMRANVFQPLDMQHTIADHTDSIIRDRTRFYVRDEDSTVINASYVDNSYKWAGGGFLSTPEDLLKFARAHMQPGFLQAETLALWQTSQRNAAGEEINYGIGWRVYEVNGRQLIGHGGGSVGGNCRLVVFPAEGIVVAVTANISNAGYGDTPERIAEKFVK